MIQRVIPESPAHRAGIRAGSALLSINGRSIRDMLDYRFYATDEIFDAVFLQDGNEISVRLERESGEDPGLEFEPMEFAFCGNQCLFCFSDQNPKGMRKALYFKDEDYRLSFLFGNYVTLTRVKENDLRRIVEQKLSPLFVSVHAFDPEIRKKLLGLKKDDRLWEKLRFLAENGIALHGQIVLCPAINDGEVLDQTVNACADFYPAFRSLAVVPVGLTRHRRRNGLVPLKQYDSTSAETVVKRIHKKQNAFAKTYGEAFVYLADEFYLLSGRPLPPPEHYGDFWQSDNGVGMTVRFLETFRESVRSFPRRINKPAQAVLVTGALAGPVLEKRVLPALNRIGNLKTELCVVPNRFYGDAVTVSGLLTGKDIARSLKIAPENATALLPSNCLNQDGLFLDDWTLEDLSKTTRRKAAVLDGFESFWEAL